MKHEQPKTHAVEHNGKKVRVTIPPDPAPAELLVDAIKDNLSPEAVAVIAAYLQPAHCGDERIDRQVQWFVEQLVKLLGGDDAFNRVCDELKL